MTQDFKKKEEIYKIKYILQYITQGCFITQATEQDIKRPSHPCSWVCDTDVAFTI